MGIRLTQGNQQTYRLRCQDITLRGKVDAGLIPVARAQFCLNAGPPEPLYVEEVPDDGVDWVAGYKTSPSELRCREPGEFCVEIDTTAPHLLAGENELKIEVEGDGGRAECLVRLHWEPSPLPLPLDLRDLTRFSDIQEVGQIINGAFDLDRAQNLIRSRAPVAPDACLVLGSAHGGQEATYRVRFPTLEGAKWLGLSDFYVGQEYGVPPRGIKVGWSSAGMAALDPKLGGRSFIAWGDHSSRPEEWAVATNPPAAFAVTRDSAYRVRHQVSFAGGINRVRYRIWPEGQEEPALWLCSEQDSAVPRHLPRHERASFSLFQHFGQPIEWSDILVRELTGAAADLPAPDGGREPFLGRERPGSF